MPGPLTVLNIEDSKSDSDMIARLLKKAGYKITFERVETAAQMRAALQKRAWDIIISDHSLPQFDSYAALAVLHEEGQDIPFITVSGIIGEEAAVAMLKAGAHDYVMKDNLTRLIPAVEHELEYAKVRRERKQAEDALHASEMRFRALIENSLDDISLLSADGTLIWESPSVIRNLDYAPDKFMGRNIFELMHPDDLELNQKLLSELIQKPAGRQSGSFRLRRNDGTWRWIEAIATNLLNEPSVQAIVINYRDVTERRYAEEALRLYEARFRALIENSSDGITVVDANNSVTYSSPAIAQILGYTPEERLGNNLTELMHPDEVQSHLAQLGQLLQTPGGVVVSQARFRHRDGSWRSLEITGKNLLHDPAVQGIVGNYHDITERKRAEQRSQTLLEAAPDSVLVVNTEGKIIIANTQSEALFGYPLGELIGRSIEMLIPERFHQNHPSHRENYYAAPRSRQMGSGLELFARRRDGSEFPVDISLNALETEEGKSTVVAIRDITERKRAEDALLASEASLQGILQSTADGILAVSLENKVLFTNDHFAEMWKIPQEVISNKNDTILLQYVLDQLTDPQGFLNKVQELYKSQNESFDVIYFKDGRVFERLSKPIMNGEKPAGRVWSFRDITERKQAEQKLRDTEGLFRELVDNIEEVFWITESASKKDQYISPAYEKVWGRLLKDVDDFVESVLPEDQPIVLAALEKQKLGKKTEIEYRIGHLDGSVHWVWDRAFPIFDGSDKVKNVAGIATDITARKQAEEVVRKSESRFRSLFEDSPIALWEEDFSAVKQRIEALREQGVMNFQEYFKLHPQEVTECQSLVKVLDVNEVAIKLFNAEKKDDLLKSIAELSKDEPLQQFQNELVNIAEGKTVFGWEGFIRTNDGKQKSIELSWHAVRDHESSLSRVIVSMIDITERKHSEEALRESEERFHSLFNRMMDGVYRSKHEGRFVDVNPAMVKMFGYSSKEEMLAVDIKDELYFEPEERGSHILDTGQEEMDVYRMRRKDGSEIWVEDHGSYVHDEQGNIIYHEGILRDITERKRADQALSESESRFRQAIAAADAIPYSLNYALDHYTFIGDGITKLAEYSLEEMTPALLDSLIVESIMHGRFEGVPLDEAVKLVREGKSGIFWRCDHRIRTRSGEERWISDSSVQVLDENGTPKGSVGIIQDITERKQIEAAAREGEVRYRSLFEDSPVSLWEEDFSAVKLKLDALRDEGVKDFRAYFASHPQIIPEYISLVKIADVNKATLKLYGAKTKADLYQDLNRFVDNDSTQVFQNELISIAQGKTHFEWEGVNQTLDGSQIVVRLSLSVIAGYEDTFSKVIISMVDITARMQAEKAIRESEKSLRESQAIAGLGSYVLDIPSGKWASSEILNQIFGINEAYTYSVENWIALIHPDWRQEMSDYFANEVLGNHIRFNKEYKIIRKNDEAERWVHGLGELEFDVHDQPVKMRGTIQDITKRRQTEEVIRNNEERFTQLANNIQEAFWMTDIESGKEIYLSPAAEMIWRKPVEELMASPSSFLEMILPEDRETVISAGAKHRSGEKTEIEYRVLWPDGSVHWVWDRAFPIYNNQGKIVRVAGLAADITDRKQAEEVISQQAVEYKRMLSTITEGFWLVNEQGRLLDVNDAYCSMSGYSKEELLQFTIQDIDAAESLEETARHMQTIMETGTDRFESKHKTKNGEVFDVEVSAAFWYEKKRFFVFIQDITERKQVEESLQKAEIKYRMLVERLPVIVYTSELGGNGAWPYVSPQIEHLLGFTAEEWMADPGLWYQQVHVDDRDRQQKLEEQAWARQESFESEYRIFTRDGRQIWVRDSAQIQPPQNNGAPTVQGVLMDITERKQAEEQIKQLASAVEQTADCVIITDRKGIIQYVNAAFEEETGYTREEALGKTPGILKSDEHDSQFYETLWKTILSGNSFKAVFTNRNKAGELYYEQKTITPIKDSQGNITHFVSSAKNVTKQMQIETALFKSEQRYRALFEDMPLSIWEEDFSEAKQYLDALKGQGVTDFRTYFNRKPEAFLECATMIRILDVNQATLKMYHADSKEDLYKSMDEGLNESEVEHILDALIAISEGKVSHSWEGVDETVTGESIEVSLNWTVAPGHEVDFSKVIVTTMDITKRKKAEAENKYQLSELEALYENGLAISRLLEPKRIAQRMVEVIDQKLKWHHAAVRLYDAKNDRIELLALNSPGFNEEQIAEQIVRINQAINTPDKGLSGWVIRHGEVVRIGKLKDDPRYLETYAGINSGLYVPIKTGDEVIGSIAVESEQENAFTERDANTLTTLASQAAISFVNARLYLWLQKELDERLKAEEEIRKLNIELEQRVAERTAQIEATKRRLELATHAGQIGVWEYIPRENKVIWDERMHMIHQIPPGKFDGTSETWGQLMHPDDLEQLQINRQLAFTRNLLMNNEHRIIWPDGSIRHIMASAVMAYSAEGTPDRIIGINMDITERKQIEQSLRESENYARLLFDAVPDPVSVIDADEVIVDVNTVFEKQFNLDRDEIRGKSIANLGIYPQSELEKREKYISEVVQGRVIKPVELEYYVPGDRIHTLELHSYLLTVNGRQLVLNTSHDITSHKKAEEAQRLAKSEIERALRIKNEFLANMSHELRTPLNSILGISESLEEQIAGTLNEKQLKYIGIVRESGRHLLELINDILDLSKIEAGRMELDYHRISVETLCQSSLRMIKELSQKKSLHVSFKVQGDVKIVLADQRRVKQSIVNLLSNAVKFTPHGKEIGLEVTGNAEKNEVEFTIWDQGVGIAPEDIQRLFKPFVQLDAGLAREYQGTGLGLALVAQMVNLHGGRVSVTSELGKGSRFTITLPWSPDEQTPKAKVTAELSLPSPRSDEKRNGKILLVEDTDVVVQLISEYLRYKGYEIILAHNGVEGIKLAEQERPDLILMDVMMPIMDGLEATRRIRANEMLKNIPIIALTALAMSGDSERCIAAGMNDYLSKPLQMQNLADMIEKYLKPAGEESNDQ